MLDIPFEFFHISKGGIKYKSYTNLYQIGSIRLYGDPKSTEDNPLGLGCYLHLSGRGCDELQGTFSGNREEIDKWDYEAEYGWFFRRCENYYARSGYHLTRLDIAIDDKNETPYFTIEQIQRKCLKQEFISSSRTFRFAESSFEGYETAKTVYIGDGKSNVSYRFYDKDKECSGKYDIPYEEIGSWKRTEIQFRDDMAQEFARKMSEDPYAIGKLTFDFLGSSLRFVTEDKNQTNKSRWNTCRFWERYLGAVKPLKLQVTKPQNSLYQTQEWLKQGGALSAVKVFAFLEEYQALDDLESLSYLIHNIRYSGELSSKVVSHLRNIDRDDLIPLIYAETK